MSDFHKAREEMKARLQEDYGKESWENIFHVHVPSDDSDENADNKKVPSGRIYLASPSVSEEEGYEPDCRFTLMESHAASIHDQVTQSS